MAPIPKSSAQVRLFVFHLLFYDYFSRSQPPAENAERMKRNPSQPHHKQELKNWRDSGQRSTPARGWTGYSSSCRRELSNHHRILFHTLQLPTPAVQLPPLLPQVGTHADGMGGGFKPGIQRHSVSPGIGSIFLVSPTQLLIISNVNTLFSWKLGTNQLLFFLSLQ